MDSLSLKSLNIDPICVRSKKSKKIDYPPMLSNGLVSSNFTLMGRREEILVLAKEQATG